jgi:hypothetical protein
MQLRYLLDENLSPRVTLTVRRHYPEIDVLRVGDTGAPAFGTLDPELLNWLDAHQRVLVTDNRSSMPNYAFGELSELAKTRREVLAGLLPRLKIAARCELTERFLRVRGDLRTYKIHLGSGNILMEPNDQYLCIVPGRGATTPTSDGTRFVPFEGDNTLAIILSKALLLAEDTAIQDPTITRQLHL